jgi:hypothetical protein
MVLRWDDRVMSIMFEGLFELINDIAVASSGARTISRMSSRTCTNWKRFRS